MTTAALALVNLNAHYNDYFVSFYFLAEVTESLIGSWTRYSKKFSPILCDVKNINMLLANYGFCISSENAHISKVCFGLILASAWFGFTINGCYKSVLCHWELLAYRIWLLRMLNCLTQNI